MRQKALALFFTLFMLSEAGAQPTVKYDRMEYRSEFIGYSLRDTAVKGAREDEKYYISPEEVSVIDEQGVHAYVYGLEIPMTWAERKFFLHTEGGRNSHRAYVNGIYVGSSRDSGVPSEFDISRAVNVGGPNIVIIEIPNDTKEPETALENSRKELESVFIYSQPRTRIVDYNVSALSDAATEGNGIFNLDIVIENDYNYNEQFTLGYDIFSPEGKLIHYDMKDIDLSGRSRDTVSFEQIIYGAAKSEWSAASPKLYGVMLFIRKDGLILEYIPVNIGFGSTSWNENGILRNGTPVDMKAVSYNASTPEQTRKSMRDLKKKGINTLYPDYPQPWWFYDICDSEGMYVIDQANINSSHDVHNIKTGGSFSNDPEWTEEYLERVKAMYYRSHNHACIIGWSLGGYSGNGYNMYKAYRWLSEKDPDRAVTYKDARGEWNSDVELPAPLSHP